jgi:hypothetical protein
MFAHDLHFLLGALSAAAILAATVEGAVRIGTGHPAGVAAERTRTTLLFLVGMTAAAGLALLATGHHPKEWVHLVYGVLAFGLIPVADNAATSLSSDRARAVARLGGGVVALVVVTRLFVTG